MHEEETAGGGCPLCGGSKFVAARQSLLDCSDCGLMVSRDIWSSGVNARHEADWFGEMYRADSSWWEQQFEAWKDQRTLRALASAGVNNGRLLEVGVGRGSLLLAARSTGFEVHGADLSPALCDRLARLGVPVHCGDVAAFAPSRPFDVIVMNHVLEHVEDPVGFLTDPAANR